MVYRLNMKDSLMRLVPPDGQAPPLAAASGVRKYD
jgi:hypothetical protein